jgi:hypothetical protein
MKQIIQEKAASFVLAAEPQGKGEKDRVLQNQQELSNSLIIV